jgi:hypothetical protein
MAPVSISLALVSQAAWPVALTSRLGGVNVSSARSIELRLSLPPIWGEQR